MAPIVVTMGVSYIIFISYFREMRFICNRLKIAIIEKYGNLPQEDLDKVIRVTVGGVYFLRLVNPIISSPQMYGLVEGSPQAGSGRNLTLISKILQNLSNNVPFGKKESYMIPANEFINSYQTELKKFIDELCMV